MTTEVELYQRPARAVVAVTERDVVDGWVEVVGKVAKLADMISDTDFVPKALRNKPAAIAACMLTGREIGIGPMLSMKVIHMVQGTPSLSAEYKRARALERGHEIVYEEATTARCIVRGRRAGEDNWLTVTWTIDDAKRAKLLGKDVWQQHPRRMLEARATGELCDLKFPDCSWGLPTTEILEDGPVTLDGEIADAADAKAIEPPKPRTAQRRTRQAAAEPADRPSGAPSASGSEGATQDRPGPAPAATARNDDQPPLPGEEDNKEPGGPDIDKDAPGSVLDSEGMVGKIQTIYNSQMDFKRTERDQMIAATEQVIGRELTGPVDGKTHNNLSWNEALVLIDTLERCGSREHLVALLAAGEQPDSRLAAAHRMDHRGKAADREITDVIDKVSLLEEQRHG